MSWDRELEVAAAAVRQASRVCRAVQRDVDPLTLEKSDRSPVTVADFASQALVARALLEAFPDDPLVGEEDAAALRDPAHAWRLHEVSARVSAEVTADVGDVLRWIDHGGAAAVGPRAWVLDPVDGTKGFLRGEQYAVALALLVDGVPTVAALACPNLPLTDAPGAAVGTVLLAVRGAGARVAPLFEAGPARAARVSARDDVTGLRLCESVESGHTAHDRSAALVERLGITALPVRLDSQAKYGVVARGDAELYLRLPTRPGYREKVWDHAAGALVVQEAGGTVTDVDGRALDFGRGRELSANRGVVVSHGRLHDRVLATLAALGV
ncbi:3'(2'),5'-bisphosphate nucleotidase [Paraliomyxa miuraensis]|uniref:3'(2'),5'-bisphosphate nucleotidase n=1 Tax=Paraliomyxa miuraensis TaxID=376150 RepID=UPI002258F7F3|nr:3'(2'),5'-bisphosphate nucleotidase [Paraliomyxa miuraensis]MCX4245114.1 3'(2'),5'-bisphosphate nucleotidase [Paraliomyxa miuraensis]